MSPKNVWIPTLLAWAMTALPAAAQQMHPAQDIRRTAETFAASQAAAGDGVMVHATAEPLDARLRLAMCAQPLSAALPAGARLAARSTVGVSCAQPRWTVYVGVALETQLPVLVLRQAAARNSHLSADDVETRTLRVPGLAVSYITSTSQLADRHLRQDAPAGTALTVDLLAADILVKRGQRVTLVASTGTLEVRAQGEAVADATPAGRVRVLNLNSRRIVEGQVESRDRVRVAL